MNINKDQREDEKLTHFIKVRLTENQYNELQAMAFQRHVYLSTMGRKIISKYLSNVEV